jgi:hypothetical protein
LKLTFPFAISLSLDQALVPELREKNCGEVGDRAMQAIIDTAILQGRQPFDALARPEIVVIRAE